MIVAAEGAGVTLPPLCHAGRGVSASRLAISFEGPGADSGTERSALPAASAAVEIVPVIKRSASGVVPAAVIKWRIDRASRIPNGPIPSQSRQTSRFQSRVRTKDTGRQTRFRDTDTIPATPRWDIRKPARDHRPEHKPHRDRRARMSMSEPCVLYDLLRRVLKIAGSLALCGASPAPHPSHPAAGCSKRRRETTSRKDSCPYFPAPREMP